MVTYLTVIAACTVLSRGPTAVSAAEESCNSADRAFAALPGSQLYLSPMERYHQLAALLAQCGQSEAPQLLDHWTELWQRFLHQAHVIYQNFSESMNNEKWTLSSFMEDCQLHPTSVEQMALEFDLEAGRAAKHLEELLGKPNALSQLQYNMYLECTSLTDDMITTLYTWDGAKTSIVQRLRTAVDAYYKQACKATAHQIQTLCPNCLSKVQ